MANTRSDNPERNIDPRALIGDAMPEDWQLNPTEHANCLDDRAIALKRILVSETIETIMRRFDRHDELAASHQSNYKQLGQREIYFGAAAAILGALILFISDSANLNPYVDKLRILLLIAQISCASLLVATQYRSRNQQPYIKWQVARSKAETARIELFETACGLTERQWDNVEKPGDFPLLPLQLEYFFRYQFLVQSKYYEERGAEHQKANDRYIGTGAILTFVFALAVGLIGAIDKLGDSIIIVSMAALIAPILLTSKTSMSRLDQDERNAARYGMTFDLLEIRRADLDVVRVAALEGNAGAVHAFIRSIDEIVSVEHSQWLVQQRTTDTVKLDAQ